MTIRLLIAIVFCGCAPGQEFRMEFVPIAPGEFLMGCAPDDSPNLPDGIWSLCPPESKPQHPVRITKPFELGKFEVTQAQWVAVMGSNPSHFEGADHPVEQITWDDVHEFLLKLNARRDGYRYRLPAEVEWEYAARAGATDQFGGGSLRKSAWSGEGIGTIPESPGGTHPVGTKAPSAWGTFDMIGNVAEWVEDWYSDSYYKVSPVDDPKGPAEEKYHVARGGSWFSNARYTRVWNRYETVPVLKRRDVGFRIVRDPAR